MAPALSPDVARQPRQARCPRDGITILGEETMREATLLSAGLRPVLRFERHLPGSVEIVWQAVTNADEMRTWFPTRIELDEWKVGATLIHHFDGHDMGP